jgi:HAD superfamily hydrolase (TIGR01549 family)
VIKAVLFDWFNTLATYDPPREELYRKAFQEFNFGLPLKTVYKGLQVGDRFFFSESGKALVRGKSPGVRALQFVRYVQAICDEAGISLPPDKQLAMIKKVLKEFTGVFKLFEEVLPLFSALKEKGYVLGIISNADKSIGEQIDRTGIKRYLDVLVTSDQVGVEKPDAKIFLAALDRTQIKAENAIYVGDQYQSDILGALNVGMKAVLMDRYEINTNISGCPRIITLNEITAYL